MPKIIVTSRYMRNSPKRTASRLVKYMGTREGVEKLPGIDNRPATKKQIDLVADCITTVPEAWAYPELQDYLQKETRQAASEFLDAFIERNADRIDGVKKLVKYFGERPGVEKLGKHGLFSQTDDSIDLDVVADEVGVHKGIIWTHVVSLHREDAERLGYNNAEAWKELARRNVTEIAQAHGITLSNLQWYAAFHNTTHHPHMHLLVYSKDAKQGWLTEKGIENLRSTFGNDIFRNEQYKLFTMETELRNKLKDEFRQELSDRLMRIAESYEPAPQLILLFQKLAKQLKGHTGRKQYGYLPAEIKKTVNEIVAEMAKAPDIAKLYSEWNKINREKLSLYYDRKKPNIPLEDNKEFRSIKNLIVKAAAAMLQSKPIAESTNYSVTPALQSLVSALARLIAQDYVRKLTRLNQQVDSKLRSKIDQKKVAHGIKIERTNIEQDEDEEQTLGM